MRYVVYVRTIEEDLLLLGVFGTRASAERKADAIKKQITAQAKDDDHPVWAYVGVLQNAGWSAREVVAHALRPA